MSKGTLNLMWMSVPCRAVVYLTEHSKIECDYTVVDLMKGEHMTEENLKENPKHSIPWYTEGKDFSVNGSEAIMKYIASKNKSSLYPDDLKKRANIDEMMNWAQNTVYRALGYQHIYPHMGWGLDTDCKYDAKKTDEVLTMCNTFLSKSKYICGDELSLGDLQLYAVFTQYKWVAKGKKFAGLREKGAELSQLFKGRDALKKWYEDVDSMDFIKKTNAMGLDGFCGYMASLE